MLQFLHPLWFWAVAGVAIPIAIHLWNTSSGKVLKIGSVAFIPDSVRKSSRRIRMAEWLLLFLRCLLIFLIAIFLAEPVWNQEKNIVKEKGWILASPEIQPENFSTAKSLIDSLETVGYVFKKWDTGFATINKTEWLEKKSPDQLESALKPWDIVRAIDHKVNAELPVYIFSERKYSDFNTLKI